MPETKAGTVEATLRPLQSRYKLNFCRSEPMDCGNGLTVVTGDSPCLYPERKGQFCAGHENQNWSYIVGLETYREYPEGPEYVESKQAQQVVTAVNSFAATQTQLIELRIARLEEALRRADRTCEHMHHDKHEQHEGFDCPVEKWVNDALKEGE